MIPRGAKEVCTLGPTCFDLLLAALMAWRIQSRGRSAAGVWVSIYGDWSVWQWDPDRTHERRHRAH